MDARALAFLPFAPCPGEGPGLGLEGGLRDMVERKRREKKKKTRYSFLFFLFFFFLWPTSSRGNVNE